MVLRHFPHPPGSWSSILAVAERSPICLIQLGSLSIALSLLPQLFLLHPQLLTSQRNHRASSSLTGSVYIVSWWGKISSHFLDVLSFLEPAWCLPVIPQLGSSPNSLSRQLDLSSPPYATFFFHHKQLKQLELTFLVRRQNGTTTWEMSVGTSYKVK